MLLEREQVLNVTMSTTYNTILIVFLAILFRDCLGAQTNSTKTNTNTTTPPPASSPAPPPKPRNATFFAYLCGPETNIFLPNSTFKKNLDYVLSNLTDRSKTDPYGESGASHNTPDAVYGQYYCRGDILMNSTLCGACVAAAVRRVWGSCPGVRNGVVWFQECTLWFSNATVAGVEAEYPRAWWISAANVNGLSDAINYTLTRLTHVAAFESTLTSYGAGESPGVTAFGKVYCLVQCSPDVVGVACDACLRAASAFASNRTDNYLSRWAFVNLASCQLSYSSIKRFYALPGDPPVAPFTVDPLEPPPGPVQTAASAPVVAATTPPASPRPPGKDGVKLVAIIVVVVCLGLTLICLLSCIWFCVLRKEVKLMNSTGRRKLSDEVTQIESVEGRPVRNI